VTPQQYTLTVGHAERRRTSHDWAGRPWPSTWWTRRAGVANLRAQVKWRVHGKGASARPALGRDGTPGRCLEAGFDRSARGGQGNDESVRFLAELAGVPRARVRIVTA